MDTVRELAADMTYLGMDDSIIELAAEVAEVEKERDEWEKRYDNLLADIGGVSPR